jgi:hypothetical protein
MLWLLAFFCILLLSFNVYVIFAQVWKDKDFSKQDKVIWTAILIMIPLFGLWLWSYRKSKLKRKNLIRF